MVRLLEPVTPPPATTPTVGLFVTARVLREGGNWRRGLTYLPEVPGGYAPVSECIDTPAGLGETRTPSPAVEARSFSIEFEDNCRLMRGRDQAEVRARLDRIVAGTESFAVAREFWTGELTKAEAAAPGNDLEPNPHLADADAVTVLGAGAAVSPKAAVAMLEQAVGEATLGSQVAYLHAAPAVAEFLENITKTGGILTTRRDSQVIADAGYPGTAPNGTAPATGEGWLYATGPVVVRADPDGLVLDDVDRAVNRGHAAVVKHYAVTFDPAVLFAVRVRLERPVNTPAT